MNCAIKYIEPICYNCAHRSNFVNGAKGIMCKKHTKYIDSLYYTCNDFKEKMKNILAILNKIEATPKKLEKLSILEENKDNESLKSVLIHALDPRIIYHIKKIPEYETIKYCDLYDIDWGINKLSKLSSRELTGGAGALYLADILSRISTDDAIVIERIIKKDLRVGMSKKTANKIWGKDFIPEFPVMLASSMNEKNLAKINYPAFVQTKMDGMRAMILIKDYNVSVFTRNGKPIDVGSQFTELVDVDISNDFVIDGELLIVDSNGTPLDRKTGNGILNKALKGTISDEERKMVRMVAWDYIPMQNFNDGQCDILTKSRLYHLDSIIKNVPNITMIDNHIVKDYEAASVIFNSLLDKGEEGVIIKNISSPWVNKRSPDLVKMKEILEADLEIVDVKEGEGKFTGALGAFIVKDSSGGTLCAVGTGFDDEQRKEYWSNRNSLKGNIVAVQYNAKIKSKSNDLGSLFLPVFVEMRDDKDEADNLWKK